MFNRLDVRFEKDRRCQLENGGKRYIREYIREYSRRKVRLQKLIV